MRGVELMVLGIERQAAANSKKDHFISRDAEMAAGSECGEEIVCDAEGHGTGG